MTPEALLIALFGAAAKLLTKDEARRENELGPGSSAYSRLE